MKANHSFPFRYMAGIAPMFVVAGLCAAPLTWFPGPSLDTPISGAVATRASGGNILLIGGDSYYSPVSYPKSLGATNSFWTYLQEMDGVRIAPGAVANGDMIIVYGGSDGTNSTETVVGYSTSDSPVNLASMSVARSHLGYAPDGNGNAYAIGGLDYTGQPLSSAESYNQDSDTWAAIAPLPSGRYDFPAVFDGSRYIYAFGGRTNKTSRTETAAVLRYSVSENGWSAMAPMPIAVAGSAAAFGADGKIYVCGGASGGVTTNVVQVYNPAANSWVISTPLPESLSASAMGVDSLGRLILIGGTDTNSDDVSDVWRSQQLGVPDSVPTLTQYPGASAKYQVPYVSSISATGNPQPTYLVLNGPAGMQVDTYSGAITWTPQADQIGSNSVTIRATNYAGFVDWSFTINVPYPPPTSPTNLTVVGVTDDSVTLSWDPESPVVGPVTFSVYLSHSSHSPRGSGVTVWYTQIGSNTTVPAITITGLRPGLAQGYYVIATGLGGSTGYGPSIYATTTSPQAPPGLYLTGLTSTTVSFAWDPSPGPAQNASYSAITSYAIGQYIPGGGGGSYQILPKLTGITNTFGTVTGLAPGSSAFWIVQAFDAQGYGSLSLLYLLLVTNPVPVAVTATNAIKLPGGSFQFSAQGAANHTTLVEATTNLNDPTSWVLISSFMPTNTVFTLTDTNAAQYEDRFYRVRAP